MERRSLLKTVGGIGVTASAAGAGVLATSGSAAAAEIGTIDISDSEITTDGGTITGFTVSPDVSFEYDGLDENAEWAILNFGVVGPDSTEEDPQATKLSGSEDYPNTRVYVDENDSMGTRAGEATYDFGTFDVLAESNWSAEDFEETEEGQTKETEVTFYVLFTLRAEGGGRIEGVPSVSETGSVTVSVTNEQATGEVGADGDTSVSGENQEN